MPANTASASEGDDVSSDDAPPPAQVASPAKASRWGSAFDGGICLALAALMVISFEGLIKVNKVRSGQYRLYGFDWFDRVSLKEAAFFMGMIFLSAPAAALVARVLLLWAGRAIDRVTDVIVARPRQFLVACMLMAAIATGLVGWKAVKHTPLTDDENVQLFQARILETGKLTLPEPPAFGPFEQPQLVSREGAWTGIFQWGHVALIAVGDLAGFPWLWSHLAVLLVLLLTYALARELYPDDRVTAVASVALITSSPFLIFSGATLHNGVTSAVLVALGAWALVRHVNRGGFAWALLAGAAFGADLHARPFNAMVLGGALGLLAVVILRARKRSWLPLVGGMFVGVVPFVALQLIIDWQITGDPMRPVLAWARGYKRLFGFRERMAFGIKHTPSVALGKTGTNLMRFAMWVGGSALTALAVLAAAAGLRRARKDLLLLVPVAALFGAYFFFFRSPASDTGPVYFLDVLPFFAIFLARMLLAARDFIAARRPQMVSPGRPVVAFAVASLAIALATWWPTQARGVRKMAESIRAPYDMVERSGIQNAIVWWNVPPGGKSWVTNPRLPRPDFSDSVIYSRDTSGKYDLMRAFPGRRTYQIRYPGNRPTLLYWTPGESEGASPYTYPIFPREATELGGPGNQRGGASVDTDKPNLMPWVPLKPDQVEGDLR